MQIVERLWSDCSECCWLWSRWSNCGAISECMVLIAEHKELIMECAELIVDCKKLTVSCGWLVARVDGEGDEQWGKKVVCQHVWLLIASEVWYGHPHLTLSWIKVKFVGKGHDHWVDEGVRSGMLYGRTSNMASCPGFDAYQYGGLHRPTWPPAAPVASTNMTDGFGSGMPYCLENIIVVGPGYTQLTTVKSFASGNQAGRCRWSADFLRHLPFLPPLHSGTAPFSPHFTIIDSQDFVALGFQSAGMCGPLLETSIGRSLRAECGNREIGEENGQYQEIARRWWAEFLWCEWTRGHGPGRVKATVRESLRLSGKHGTVLKYTISIQRIWGSRVRIPDAQISSLRQNIEQLFFHKNCQIHVCSTKKQTASESVVQGCPSAAQPEIDQQTLVTAVPTAQFEIITWPLHGEFSTHSENECIWNARVGETVEPRENSLTSDIVRHDFHMQHSWSDRVRDRTLISLVGDKRTVIDDATSRRVFSGISLLSRPCIPALIHSHLVSISRLSEEIWVALDIEVFRADEGEASEMSMERCRNIPEKTCRPSASSCMIPACENSGEVAIGIEPGLPSTKPRWHQLPTCIHIGMTLPATPYNPTPTLHPSDMVRLHDANHSPPPPLLAVSARYWGLFTRAACDCHFSQLSQDGGDWLQGSRWLPRSLHSHDTSHLHPSPEHRESSARVGVFPGRRGTCPDKTSLSEPIVLIDSHHMQRQPSRNDEPRRAIVSQLETTYDLRRASSPAATRHGSQLFRRCVEAGAARVGELYPAGHYGLSKTCVRRINIYLAPPGQEREYLHIAIFHPGVFGDELVANADVLCRGAVVLQRSELSSSHEGFLLVLPSMHFLHFYILILNSPRPQSAFTGLASKAIGARYICHAAVWIELSECWEGGRGLSRATGRVSIPYPTPASGASPSDWLDNSLSRHTEALDTSSALRTYILEKKCSHNVSLRYSCPVCDEDDLCQQSTNPMAGIERLTTSVQKSQQGEAQFEKIEPKRKVTANNEYIQDALRPQTMTDTSASPPVFGRAGDKERTDSC
ncbi:hypothetical protein PR048_016649 [Dryococelus australis]|uniref:Uncharacterized protein n=1 Tax=Dryococelus australis TaxID=614101 RepID=A0ABQ9H7C5_9NEOP|nr:hypothetical protein PR048_016649 [Dryococelus australis]